MVVKIDIVGQKFGRWLVLSRSERRNSQGVKAYLNCRCDCNVEREVQRSGLISGTSTSCGCLHRERVSGKKKAPLVVHCQVCGQGFTTYPSACRKYCGTACSLKGINRHATHGATGTRLYNIWHGMKARCQPGACAAEYYSDRGISVCPEWAASFETFRDWAVSNGYEDNLEIDRIDVNGGYSPDNCRWATRQQQMQNTRKRRDGKTSKFKGVSWHAGTGKWLAQIQRDKEHFHLGLFKHEEDAARAYDEAANRLHGEYAHTNHGRG